MSPAQFQGIEENKNVGKMDEAGLEAKNSIFPICRSPHSDLFSTKNVKPSPWQYLNNLGHRPTFIKTSDTAQTASSNYPAYCAALPPYSQPQRLQNAWMMQASMHTSRAEANPSNLFFEGNQRSQLEQGAYAALMSSRKRLSNLLHRTRQKAMFPLMCNICGQSFARDDELLQHHKRSHISKLKFTCLLCKRSFKSYNVLRRHKKKVHGTETSNQTEGPISTDLGEPLFKCSLCDNYYTLKGNCARHEWIKHGLLRNRHGVNYPSNSSRIQ
ncbi:unnamed protein product [Gongylonema pulchrum]|uniref:C2H2-type domain-containing protein n=1 Tax=Gongylonema pulchrum TaxID=637853 RepID=A0A183D7L6_9BILA|nr:unnamed protein product [Gongylonema pulchrum]